MGHVAVATIELHGVVHPCQSFLPKGAERRKVSNKTLLVTRALLIARS